MPSSIVYSRAGFSSSAPVFLSIILVNWNTYEATKRCLESLLDAQQDWQQEIIVVDNASTDGSATKLAEDFPQIKLIKNSKNVGFGQGCNIGLEQASGELMLFLNPDTVGNKEALARMMHFLQEHQEAGAVGCQLRLSDGTVQLSYHSFPTPFTYIVDHSLLRVVRQWVRKLVKRRVPIRAKPKSVDWLMGACIMTRRKVLDTVGGFDPRFFMYAEDIDWCKRVKESGWPIFYLPDTHIYHFHQLSSARRKFFTLIQLINSLILYYQKHKALGELALLKVIIAVDMMLRLVLLWPLQLIIPDPQGINKERIQAIWLILRSLISGKHSLDKE